MNTQSPAKPITIAIIAMGGQGGGVLSKWILSLAEANGFQAQYTSVPGVAQRTGATIYYIELFPESAIAQSGKLPVLSLTPVAGDVDIVIASEMMEAGRALMRGFVTEKTTLIASSHREYAIVEKQEMGDGRRDTSEVNRIAGETAGRYICFDMDAARDEGVVISAVLFGALAGSGALPFAAADFEETIKAGGKAVQANLTGFAAGLSRARAQAEQAAKTSTVEQTAVSNASIVDPSIAPLVREVHQTLPTRAQPNALVGLEKLLDFQGETYARDYLARLRPVVEADAVSGGDAQNWQLSTEMARYLALAMAYDDVIRVADIKTRAERFRTFRHDVKAEDDQIVHIHEFMHPRWQEICEIMPTGLGRRLRGSRFWNRITGPLFNKGRRVRTTSLLGFLLLFLLARLRFLRPKSLRFAEEQNRIDSWVEQVLQYNQTDYDLACEIAGLQRLIKGYGDTHARSLDAFAQIIGALPLIAQQREPSKALAQLKAAALKDEEGLALTNALADLSTPNQAEAA